MSSNNEERPPFWGLTLTFTPDAHALVVEDNLGERRHILDRLFSGCQVTWVASADEVKAALEAHGPFDVYSLDFDLGDQRGGWLESGHLIRQKDPLSIAKIVLIHSANTDARAYFEIFPAAIFVQWDVLATILGETEINSKLIEAILAEAGPQASVDALRDATLKIRPGT